MTIVLFFELIGPYYDSVTLFVEFQVGHQILVRFLHRFFFWLRKYHSRQNTAGTYLLAKHLDSIIYQVFELFSRIFFVFF